VLGLSFCISLRIITRVAPIPEAVLIILREYSILHKGLHRNQVPLASGGLTMQIFKKAHIFCFAVTI